MQRSPPIGVPSVPGSKSPVVVPWYRSIRTKVAIGFGALSLSLLLLVLMAAYLLGKQQLIETAVERVRFDAVRTADRFNAAAKSLRTTGAGISGLALHHSMDRAAIVRMLQTMVDNDTSAIAGLLVIEPGILPDGKALAYYAGVPTAGVLDVDFIEAGYDVFNEDWYKRTLVSPAPWWSEPYLSKTSGRWMARLNMPLRDPYRETVVGAVGLDVPMEHLAELLAPMNSIPGVQAVLYSPGGMVAVHPEDGIALKYSLEKYAAVHGRPDLLRIAEEHRARREYQSAAASGSNHGGHLVLIPVDDGWSVQLWVSDVAVLAQLEKGAWFLLSGGLLVMLLLGLLALPFCRRITDPLLSLTKAARHFGAGEFDFPLPVSKSGDEVHVLTDAFDTARTSIKSQMTEIERMASARHKLDSELSIARDIQRSMLPTAPSLRHGDNRVTTYAALEAAKAVGGDFFSFFQQDRTTLWFTIGDVSDKGIPAALFMARSLSVLEAAACRDGATPAQALREAAERLAKNNETCMFATVLCGTIDVATGFLAIASAGHEAPLMRLADGSAQRLPLDSAPPLGFEVAPSYPQWQGHLEPGEVLLAYTDGITEAFDESNLAFGDDRLEQVVIGKGDAAAVCRRVLAAVSVFAQNAPQSDDITVLAIGMDMLPTH